jgi:hypothetical protein
MMIKQLPIKKLIFIINLVFMAAVFLAAGDPAWAAPKAELPKILYWGCRYVGSSLYTIPATMAEKVGPAMGVKIRMIPGEDMEMISMLRAGRIHLATFAADNYWASMGLVNYASFAVGPQPLRLIWPGWPTGGGSTGLASKTSGIKTPYDLKGKTVVRVVGAAWSEQGIKAQLAFGNLTYADVKVVEVSSTGGTLKALAEGKADYTTGSVTAPGAYEVEASPYGLAIVAFPFEDKEGWKRMRKIVPYFAPGFSEEGAGIEKGHPVPTPMYAWPVTTALEKQSPDLVYAITKAIYNNIEDIAKSYKPNESMLPKRAIRPESTEMAPFHVGAIKFLKEVKLWTPEIDRANNAKLAQLKKVNELWEKFTEESEQQMAKTGKAVDPLKAWPPLVEQKVGLTP